MPADGNPLPRVVPEIGPAAAPALEGHEAWTRRNRPGLVAARRRQQDPAAEAMSHNPNLSPPIHFSRED